MPRFADHFSAVAGDYASYRPTYPAALFAWLAGLAPAGGCAWDCATGSGQAAHALAPHFALVVATDASEAQLRQVPRTQTMMPVAMRAEEVGLRDGSVSLVCVAQALHWFNRPDFYAEVRRVLAPAGVIAVWRYGLATVDPAVDAIVGHFYREVVGPWWPPERAIVDAGYGTIDFPFVEVEVPRFEMVADWTLAQLAGYVGTWSAVGRFRADRGEDPVASLVAALEPVWGASASRRRVSWPLEVRAGRVR